MLTDDGADDSIDFKSDHRCTHVNSLIRERTKWKRRGGRVTGNGTNLDTEAFDEQLDGLVANPPADAQSLVEAVVTAAQGCSRDPECDAKYPNIQK